MKRKQSIKLAMREFLGDRRMPRTRKARKRLAAEFVEYLGTMNQADRDFVADDKYSTDEWEEYEQLQPGAPWKDDEHNDMGFGVPRTASQRHAVEATKLAFLVLGEGQPDKVLEAQARDFLAMSPKSLKKTSKRVRKFLADVNPEFDEGVEDDDDAVSDLEEITDVGVHLDDDEIDSLEEASFDEDDDDFDDDGDVEFDDHVLAESDDTDITGEGGDEVLKLLYAEDKTRKRSAKQRKRVASRKRGRRTAQRLGRVTVPSGGGRDELSRLQGVWEKSGERKADWEGSGLFD